MSDTIGRTIVPSLVDSGAIFPLTSEMGYGFSQDWPVVVHRFGSFDAKAEQRYQVGIGPKKHAFRRSRLSLQERNQLFTFWETLQGPWKTFTYNAPAADKTLTTVKVLWEQAPLSAQYLVNACQVGFNFIEVPDPSQAPSYPINATCVGLPSSALQSALLDQVQKVIPLVHIRVRETAVPDIYLSDRRCTVGGQLYLPRLLNMGQQGTDVLISQDIKGSSDSVSFTFGNADRVMTSLSNDTDLKYAWIEFSLYHINSGILYQLWAGEILNFESNKTPQFTVQAGDPLADTTRMYPTRSVSRSCWKKFNDGINCPYSTHGSGGDPNSCDYYFDSSNGCVAHGMTPYFGGHPFTPQGTNIKDNSTGTWGIGRNTVTATSICSDSVVGESLPEIWCNSGGDPTKAFWANAMIVAVRDESDFLDALAIVGAGPLGAFTPQTVATNADGFRYVVAPLLDGQTSHGFRVDSNENITRNEPNMGLREVVGNDPQSDIFGMGAGGTPQGNATAAGTAFIEIRRTDTPGIQPSTPEQHTLQVPIDEGMSGYTWDASGNRTLVSGLINPFWIGVNDYLRSRSLWNADSATQLNAFVSSSLFAGDGTGTAEIADLAVTPIIGTGTEKQFTFQGTIASPKPFRDWLTEILAGALGYFTWEFGRLRLGCRINADPVDSYGPGSMLFQSLRLTPIDAEFEKVIIDFADSQYQYGANAAEYQDKDHAAYYGRSGTPLTGRFHMVGVSSLSLAERVAAIRTREELGGITATEWRNAKNAVWGTTLLGLNSRIGQVVTLNDPDLPGGSGSFRVQSWKLKKDYSVEITAKTVTASMYDLTTGPQPTEMPLGTMPALRYPLPSSLVWMPYQVQAAAADALYGNEWTFDVATAFASLADGTVSCTLTVTGKLPTNDYSTTIYGSPLIGSIVTAATGGSLTGGQTLRISICATDASGHLSNPSAIAIVQLPSGSNTNQITLNNIVWPSGSPTGYALFASTQDDLICAQLTGTGNPTSLTLNGPLARMTWSIPSSTVAKVRIKAKKCFSGQTQGKVTAVTGNTISLSGVSTATPYGGGNYAGAIASVIGVASGSTPFANYSITASDSGSITVSQTPTAVQLGDIVSIRFAPGSGSVTTLSTGGATFAANALVGDLVRIIAGTGRGSTPVKITSNSGSSIALASALTMDATSVWIIEDGSWTWQADGTAFDNADPQHVAQWSLNLSNLPNEAVLVSGFTVDSAGMESADGDQAVREAWISGVDPNVVVTPAGTQNGTNTTFTIPSAPANGTDIEVFRNGILCQLTIEYTVSGTTITFVHPPTAKDVIAVKMIAAL